MSSSSILPVLEEFMKDQKNLKDEVEYLQACFLSMQMELDKLIDSIPLTFGKGDYLVRRLEQIKDISPNQAKLMYEKYKFATDTEQWMKDLLKEFDK